MICPFCNVDRKIIIENDLAFAIYDGFPVTDLHTLVIPKRHTSEYFDLTSDEITAIHNLIFRQKELLDLGDSSIMGYNIGINCGEAAGQTIFHCHVHLIPRQKGDMAEPRGGIRNIIPGKGNYS